MNTKRKILTLHKEDGKKHMGKEEIQAREDAEIVMGDLNFKPPMQVKNNKVAFEKWKEVVSIFKDSGLKLVSSTDSGVIGRYCMLYADFCDLVEHRRMITDVGYPDNDIIAAKKKTMHNMDEYESKRIWKLIEYFTGLDGILKLDKMINAKASSILAIEDRIYLNPAAKVKTIPIQKKSKPVDPLEQKGFDV